MSATVHDSITDESGLFRMIYGQTSQRSLQNVQQYRQSTEHARRRKLVWFAIGTLVLAAIVWRPWTLRSSEVAPAAEVKDSVRQAN